MTSAPNTYVLGSIVTLTVIIKRDGVLTDAGTITITVQRNDGVPDGPYIPTRISQGTYSYDYETVTQGWCRPRVETLNPTSAAEGEFTVITSR